jgi:hypothetical protein
MSGQSGFGVPILRPVMITGAALILVAAGIACGVLFYPGSPAFVAKLDSSGLLVAIGVLAPAVLFYFLTGLGVLLRSKVGYYLFRAFLYIHLFVGFPVTTVFAYRGLAYTQAPSVKRHFGIRSEPGESDSSAISHRAKVVLAVVGFLLVAVYVLVMLYG